MTRDCTDALRCDKFATLARVPSRVIAARGRAIMKLDARDQLRNCTRPMLYVAGSHDRVVPRRNAEEIVRELPATRIVTIEGPHLALYTNPTGSLDPILGFIREHA
jgi:pimeloyl-ACP methyl ester carboxylesterase